LADSFGGKDDLEGADRFKLGRWTTLTTGAPVLEGALDCALERRSNVTTPSLLSADLVDYTADPARELLTSFRSGYR
jgi:flavin reductase (DIM6/NTAB) family NADH-FMN oxidoreductase RutF